MNRLDGKTAIITGGTRGVGRAIAEAFAAEGARVVVASRSSSSSDRAPDDQVYVADPLDVRDPASVGALVGHTLDRYGRVDILVANAGVMCDGKVDRLDLNQLGNMIATNVLGTVHCIQGVVPAMRDQGGGRIITMSSTIVTHPAVGTAGYAATKSAIEALTRVAAVELGRDGILVNCLSPGFLDGGMTRDLMDNPRLWDTYVKRFALRRPGQLAELASAAVFLAGADSRYVNGHVLEVNGALAWPGPAGAP